MRILFLYMFPLWGNGSGAFLRQLVRQLLNKSHEIGIVAPERRRLDGCKHYIATPPKIGVFVGNPELPEAKKYEEMNGKELSEIYISYLRTTIDAVKDFQPEIIHVFHTAFLPPIARMIKVLYGIKFIITTHGSDLHYLERDRRLWGVITDAVRVAQFITANSNFTRAWFLRMFGKQHSYKTRTIPGGVNVADFEANNDDVLGKIDKKYHLTGKKVVLFTGRLTVHKGVEYLIKAARKIQGEVLILGDGPERPYLEKMIAEYKLTNTRILGYMSKNEGIKYREFYRRADVYVAPSVWDEPLGLVILEAMAAGTPVICTRKGGISSIVKDGYNGFLVRARNSQEIADKVNYLLSHEEQRLKMAQRARRTVEEKFTWEVVAAKFERIYSKFRYSSREYFKYLQAMKGLPSNHRGI
jgi:glycosyltransferase involved in cell wall biosynthesis